MRSITTATVAVVLWLAIALGIDRWMLAPLCPTCVEVFALEVKFQLPAAQLSYPAVSVLVLIVLPMVALAIYLAPWKKWRVLAMWRDAFTRWAQPWFWLLIALLLTLLFESLYLVAKDFLPAVVTDMAGKFSAMITLSVFSDYQPISLTTSVAGFAGMVVGAYLFLYRGVADLID